MYCGNCGSPDVRALTVVYEQGVTLVNMRTIGAGIGSGVLVGAGRTRGRQVTAASVRAAPPAKRHYGGALILALLIAIFAISYPALWIGVLVCAVGVGTAMHWNVTTWPRQYADWSRLYACDRCGWVGEPERLPPPLPYDPHEHVVESPRAQLEAESGATKLCPHCRSFIPAAATVCRICRRDVDDTPRRSIAP